MGKSQSPTFCQLIVAEQAIQHDIATGMYQLYKNKYIDVEIMTKGELPRSFRNFWQVSSSSAQ